MADDKPRKDIPSSQSVRVTEEVIVKLDENQFNKLITEIQDVGALIAKIIKGK
jgi:fructose-1,6-bisphosphatase/sedoheptulose 1,7-bisphosphatase-like protein